MAGLLGVALCLWSYGPVILDGSAIDWLMSGDRAQSFLGWHFYRHAPETVPLGRIPGLLSPVGSSLAFSDAIPWFSVLLKPLSPRLPAVFQISGLWLVLSYGLLGAFGCLVLHELRAPRFVAISGSLLVVASPALTHRGAHFALCGQWLLVAAFLLALRSRGDRTIGRFARGWSTLLFFACGTHPYLATMVLGIGLASCASGTPLARLRLSGSDTSASEHAWPALLLARAGILLTVASASLLAFGYLTGPPAAASGPGTYSANLLALVDPAGASRVLPSLPRLPGQYEGYAFIGIGPLLLLAVAVFVRHRRRGNRRERAPSSVPAESFADLRLVGTAIAAMALFALGPSIRLGAWEVATARHAVAWLEPLPSVFRASGRFVWPLHYAIILGTVAWIARLLPVRASFAAILVAGFVQLADGAHFHAGNDAAAQGERTRWNPLRSPVWRAAGDGFDEIRLVPPYFHESECATSDHPPYFYVPFAFLAGTQHMRINSGHLSRQPAAALERACRDTEDEIAIGRVDPRVLYVVTDDAMERFTAARLGLATCGRLDAFSVCWDSARRTRFTSLVPVYLRPWAACVDLRQRWKPRVRRS